MPVVADPILGAKRGNELVEVLKKRYKESLVFWLKAAMADGYLIGTEPPKNASEALMAAWPTTQQLAMKMQAGEQLTIREQDFLLDFGKLLRERSDASRNGNPRSGIGET